MLRVRSEEEVMAKRTRRKKREREKGKKQGASAETDAQEEVAGEVKWEERLVTWSMIRANGKVKSFAFPPYEADKPKNGIPVSHLHREDPQN